MLNEEQIEYVKDNYDSEIEDVINDRIDNDLTYHDDIYEAVQRFSSITECLNGEYSMTDLMEDLHAEYFENDIDEIAQEVFDNLDEEEQNEILNLGVEE